MRVPRPAAGRITTHSYGSMIHGGGLFGTAAWALVRAVLASRILPRKSLPARILQTLVTEMSMVFEIIFLALSTTPSCHVQIGHSLLNSLPLSG